MTKIESVCVDKITQDISYMVYIKLLHQKLLGFLFILEKLNISLLRDYTHTISQYFN